MIDESLLKSNFIGRDGFRWWIGQIPPESSHGGQINGAGWGNRFKVRIMGYHPYNTVELPNEDLPWAQCLLPTTSGTGAGNNATTVKVSPGDTVFGFFLDGDNAQIPVIMGCFGRTSQVPSADYAGPFQPFTGYTSKIKKPNGTLKPDQSLEQNAKSQKSTRSVSPQQAEAIADDEISSFSAIGDKIPLGNTVNNTIIGKISAEVGNLLNKVKAPAIFTDIANEITRVTDKIQAITNGLVGNMVNGLYRGMIPILNSGLQLLYQSVYSIFLAATGNPAAAHLAGVAAQTAMINPIKAVEQAMPCVAGAISSGLGGLIEEVLNSVVDNVQNFVSCAANQFTGVLVNDIIGKISSGLSASLGGIQAILEFIPSFSVDGFLRNSVDSIKGIVGLFDCNQSKGKSNGIVDEWIIGCGPTNAPTPNFDEILENANVTNAIATAGDVLGGVSGVADIFGTINSISNQVGGCYTGPPLFCSAPVVTIFGGGGSGATAIPLIGAISGTTGSIIGAKVTNGGSGYRFPPFVEIRDNCNQGYGVVARSTINDVGEVDSIYIVSEGENYPTGDLYDNSAFTTADTVINSSTENQTQSLIARNYSVNKILIQNPGRNYINGDKATDQFDNEYSIEIFEGSIAKIQLINTTVIVNDIPVITIKSDTGSGAILRPILDTPPADFQGEVKQVIDCVT